MATDPHTFVPPRPGRWFTVGGLLAVLITVVVAGALVWGREAGLREQTAQLAQEAAAGRRVLVTHPRQTPPSRTLEVPATVRGFVETPIYAKIAGYLQSIAVDKGDRVSEGQLLAVLESPEIDQQVANARANYNLRVLTNKRNQELLQQALIAQQDADESHAAMLQARATLDQLEAMQAYKTIRAPFAGVIIARYVDPGALVPQATSPSGGSPLLTLATLSPVRVYADVPQSVAPFIENGDPASITVTEYPGRVFSGSITRHPDALRTTTRTMQVEVDVANEDGALLPGMYARIGLKVAQPAGPPLLPADALLFRGGKVYAAVVRDNRLDLVEVTLGYDDGQSVEITAGIKPEDLVAINVGQAARSGEVVRPMPVETP